MKRCFRVAFVQLSGWKTWNFGASWFKRLQTHGSELPQLTATNVDKKRFDAGSLCNNQQMFRPPSFIFTRTRITINWRNTVHMGFFKSEPSVLTFAMSLADVAAAWIGYAVIAGACVVKLPQILLIVSNSSAEGLSEMAAALDAVAASSFSYYNLLKGYPIAGWGEQGIVAVQATVVLILVWIYRGNNLKVRFAFFGLWMCISAAILFEGHECHLLLTSLGASPTAMTAISRIPQIFLNWQSGQTGQLSLITFFLQFLGSVARLLTTLQLIGNDALTLISHSVGAILNLVVVLQILAHHNQLKLAVKAAKVNIVALEKSVWDVSEWWVWWADSRKMRPCLADVFSSSAALRAVTIVGPVIRDSEMMEKI